MQTRARLSDDQGWRENRHDHHQGRACTLTAAACRRSSAPTRRDNADPLAMGLERRGRAVHDRREVTPAGVDPAGEEPRVRPEPKVKSFEIDKRLVYGAWEKVRANRAAPGGDAVSIERFAAAESDNLYKLWKRMSSGSYFPGPVRAVEIPKDHGAGVRVLG